MTVAIDNNALQRFTKQPKNFNMRRLGHLFALLIYKQCNKLRRTDYIPYEDLATILQINIKETSVMKVHVKKALDKLKPSIANFGYSSDSKTIRFTSLPDYPYTNTFTQLPCSLIEIQDISLDIIVLFTVLEYFKGADRAIYPSMKTLAELCGCGRTKINELIKEGSAMGLWKIESTSGGSKSCTNKYELSYIKDGVERYYFIDLLDKQNIEIEKRKKYKRISLAYTSMRKEKSI